MKHLRELLFLCLFAILPFSSVGQIVTWQLKTGVNMSKETGITSVQFKPGYQIGAVMNYSLNDHWSLQPSLLLISKGYKAKGNYPEKFGMKSYDVTSNRIYVELPLMLSYQFNTSHSSKMRLAAGGYVAYGIGGKHLNKQTLNDDTVVDNKADSFSKNSERFDAGLATEISYIINEKYAIGAFANWGLTKNTGSRNQTYGINIGYIFP